MKFIKLKKPVSILMSLLIMMSMAAISLTASASVISVLDEDAVIPEDSRFYNLSSEDVNSWWFDSDWTMLTNQNHEAAITTCKNEDEEFTFPAKIGNYDVKVIGGKYDSEWASGSPAYNVYYFYGDYNTDKYDHAGEWLKTLVIEEGVEVIGMRAFDNCNNLSNITIPSTVKYIGPRAFSCIDENAVITINSTDTVFCDNCEYRDSADRFDFSMEGGVFGYNEESVLLGWSSYDITIYGPLDSNGDSTAKDYADTHDGVTFIPLNPLDTPYNPNISANNAAKEDENEFALSGFDYTYGTLLGAQVKADNSNGIRYVAELSSDLINNSNLTDYGFEIVKTSKTTTEAFASANGFVAMDNAIRELGGAEYNTKIVKASCIGTTNNIVDGYGNIENEPETDYKYITMSINNVSSSQGIAVRFYAVIFGITWYANYTPDGSSTPYRGMCASYSSLS